ncbi:circadian clock protein KaiC [bacterium]|nr:MAG: circadian clock protein KaiC [bacterium]
MSDSNCDPKTAPGYIARAATGVDGLDEILCGGLPRNRLYLIQGDPGVGKTTLALQFLLQGVAEGEKSLYITLSETREELLQVAESHGWNLDSIAVLEMDTEDALVPDAQNTLFHTAEVELNETTERILREADRIKPTRIVFDSLAEMRLLAGAGLRYRRQILALKQHFATRNATVLLLDDLTTHSERELQSLAHGVITLEHIQPEYGSEKRRLHINKLRGVKFVGGYHDFAIKLGGLVIFPRLVAAQYTTKFERTLVSSGIAALDELTGGGLTTGTSTLLMGPAGTGKSTLALQYVSAALERGDKAAFFSFEEATSLLLSRAELMGKNLKDPYENGDFLIQQIDPAELAPGEFAAEVRRVVEKLGVRVVIIDSLNGYLYSMPEERHLILHMHELLTYLNQQGVVTILVTAQSGIMGSQMSSPIDMSYLADIVIMLRHFEAFGAVRQALSCLKKRSGGHERTIRELRIEPSGVRVGEPLSHFRGILTGVPEYIGKDKPEVAGSDE